MFDCEHFAFLFILVKTKRGYTVVAEEKEIDGETDFSLPYKKIKKTQHTVVMTRASTYS